jgi:hypothetical protein
MAVITRADPNSACAAAVPILGAEPTRETSKRLLCLQAEPILDDVPLIPVVFGKNAVGTR